ncbi:MAG: hypothetical protein GQ540_03455 [Lutibacter sp.]|uniref:hypothetical protein n=1 Tax=Lutibacter sp. TaxID=1925666 RepID=UPI0019F09839|nr:hypothetical protein [Lutibacter sp.]NOR27569.1 hypothetical protein [Lutibacter sp.]
MKVTKKVSEFGNININFTELPAVDHKVSYCVSQTSNSYQHNDLSLSHLDNVQFGDLTIDLSMPIPSLTSYNKKNSVEHIADVIQKRADYINYCCAEYVKKNTESCDILSKDSALEKLAESNNVFYRNKKGQIQKLDI